jgi:hypothetical protein
LFFVIVLAALAFLMFAAYRGYSVILVAPIAALGAVRLTGPAAVAPVFSDIFMEKMVGFVKLYFRDRPGLKRRVLAEHVTLFLHLLSPSQDQMGKRSETRRQVPWPPQRQAY